MIIKLNSVQLQLQLPAGTELGNNYHNINICVIIPDLHYNQIYIIARFAILKDLHYHQIRNITRFTLSPDLQYNQINNESSDYNVQINNIT